MPTALRPPTPNPCMLRGMGEQVHNRTGRGRSYQPEAEEPVGELDRRATTNSTGSPNSRWSRSSELALRKAGRGSKSRRVMTQEGKVYVGIDVAKASLEVALSSGECFAVANDDEGIAQAVQRLKAGAPVLVVMEASGGYERQAWVALWEAGLPVALVNPRDTYHFAQANRQLAKTDRLDARGLMWFGAQIQPAPCAPPSADNQELSELVGRRRQLVNMLTAERNRRQQVTTKPSKRSIERTIKSLVRERHSIDRAIADKLKHSVQLVDLDHLLRTARGVAAVVSATLITRLPELGTLSEGQVGALVGGAPFDRKSGRWNGESHIFGGRAEVRTALYMAVTTAKRYPGPIRDLYERLRKAGKQHKVAMIACVRKFAIILNAMVKHHTPWRSSWAAAS
jgi:transposase